MDKIDQRIIDATANIYELSLKNPIVNPILWHITNDVRMIYLNEFGHISIELLDDLSEDYKAGFMWGFIDVQLQDYITENNLR